MQQLNIGLKNYLGTTLYFKRVWFLKTSLAWICLHFTRVLRVLVNLIHSVSKLGTCVSLSLSCDTKHLN